MLIVEAELVGGACRLRATNGGDRAVHVLDDERLPWVLPDGDGLLVLHGLHARTDDDVDGYGVEVPTTRPLEPGGELVALAPLEPPVLRSLHGGGGPIPLGPGAPVRTAVGWGTTELDEPTLVRSSLTHLLAAWQRLAEGPVLRLP